jgi:hypothetical protein
LDEKFTEYLEQEQKMEESPDILVGQTKRYNWQQNAKELDVYIPLEDISTKSKDISCKITTSSVSVKVKGEVLVEGQFASDVVPAECNWQIGNYLPSNVYYL